jgi:hypothetical protein
VVILNPLPQIPRAQDGNFNAACLAPEDCVVILIHLAQAPMPGPRALCVVIPNPLPQIPRAQDGNFNPPCLAPEHCVVILDRLAQASMPGHKALCAHSKALTPDPQSTKWHF